MKEEQAEALETGVHRVCNKLFLLKDVLDQIRNNAEELKSLTKPNLVEIYELLVRIERLLNHTNSSLEDFRQNFEPKKVARFLMANAATLKRVEELLEKKQL